MSVNVVKNGELLQIAGNSKSDYEYFNGTTAEVNQAIASGKIEDGTIVNITDDYDPKEIFDDALSADSSNAVQNSVITAKFAEVEGRANLRYHLSYVYYHDGNDVQIPWNRLDNHVYIIAMFTTDGIKTIAIRNKEVLVDNFNTGARISDGAITLNPGGSWYTSIPTILPY